MATPPLSTPCDTNSDLQLSTDGLISSSQKSFSSASKENTTPEQAFSTPDTLAVAEGEKTRFEFVLDWSLKVLGFIGVVAFGIWAPLSYKATLQQNHGNDAIKSFIRQSQNMPAYANTQGNGGSSPTSASQDTLVLSAFSAQITYMSVMQNYQAQLGQLQLLEFCLAHDVTEIHYCSSLGTKPPARAILKSHGK